MAEIGKDIQKAIELLSSSELVGIPTETVYGLAANAYDAKAVAKIYSVKDRPSFDPLIVHASDIDQVAKFTLRMPEKAYRLGQHLWPGPMTIVLKKKDIIPDLVTSGLDTVAVRVPKHKLTSQLLNLLDFPLAAPSANPFGYVSPTKAEHVDEQLGEKIKYILDGGNCKVGIESTIITFEDENAKVLRLGGCSIEEIEDLIGKVEIATNNNSNPAAPGMLDSHYAPLTPLEVGDIDQLIAKHKDKKVGILAFFRKHKDVHVRRQLVLSRSADVEEAAARLFSGLRQLDAMKLDIILCEYVPDEGVGRAINDRLTRAEIKRN